VLAILAEKKAKALGRGRRTEPMKLKVTLDTNTLPLERAIVAATRIGADVVVTTVTAREVRGTKFEPELSILKLLPETMVLGESPLGGAVLGSEDDATCYEGALSIISNGSFPRPGTRGALSDGQQRQLRDAMIFCAHVREKRDIFVSDDTAAFGEENSPQRQRIEALGKTRVMTLPEFERFCDRPRA
jgi:hypothetical protein